MTRLTHPYRRTITVVGLNVLQLVFGLVAVVLAAMALEARRVFGPARPHRGSLPGGRATGRR